MNSLPADSLLDWYSRNSRDLPWRSDPNPWAVWVSEIMLQQTRVDTVIPYFHRFMRKFPSVDALASAERIELMKAWEGLGYYSRGRNLQDSARVVVERFEGEIPNNRRDLLSLKGIGPYTVAAILSIAFNKPEAVVDGNVIRVFSRYYGIAEDVRKIKVRNQIEDLAMQSLDRQQPGDFNQAVMDLGALICKPSSPDCSNCPIRTGCLAYRTASTDSIPYKSPKKRPPHHHIGVGVLLNSRKQMLISLRPEDSMLGGLWEFPGGKKFEHESIIETVERELKEELGVEVDVADKIMAIDHAYSHFSITLHAYWCTIRAGTVEPKSSDRLEWVSTTELHNYPFPKANRVLINRIVIAGIPETVTSPEVGTDFKKIREAGSE
ncbi:MAG: A/G-specific adenine glycosylase [Balneolaceae bacterium]